MNKRFWEAYFHQLRFDPNYHLGLGDVRLTLAMQEEIIEWASWREQVEDNKNEYN